MFLFPRIQGTWQGQLLVIVGTWVIGKQSTLTGAETIHLCLLANQPQNHLFRALNVSDPSFEQKSTSTFVQ